MGDPIRNSDARERSGTMRTSTTTTNTTATAGSAPGNAGATSAPATQGGADGQFHHIGQGQWTATQPSPASATPASNARAHSNLPSPEKLYERFPGLRGIDLSQILMSAIDPAAFPCAAMKDYAPEDVLWAVKELAEDGEGKPRAAGNIVAFLAAFPSAQSFLTAYPELGEISPFDCDDAAAFERHLEAAIGEKECSRLKERFTPAAILHGFRALRVREFEEKANVLPTPDERGDDAGDAPHSDPAGEQPASPATTYSSFSDNRNDGPAPLGETDLFEALRAAGAAVQPSLAEGGLYMAGRRGWDPSHYQLAMSPDQDHDETALHELMLPHGRAPDLADPADDRRAVSATTSPSFDNDASDGPARLSETDLFEALRGAGASVQPSLAEGGLYMASNRGWDPSNFQLFVSEDHEHGMLVSSPHGQLAQPGGAGSAAMQPESSDSDSDTEPESDVDTEVPRDSAMDRTPSSDDGDRIFEHDEAGSDHEGT